MFFSANNFQSFVTCSVFSYNPLCCEVFNAQNLKTLLLFYLENAKWHVLIHLSCLTCVVVCFLIMESFSAEYAVLGHFSVCSGDQKKCSSGDDSSH